MMKSFARSAMLAGALLATRALPVLAQEEEEPASVSSSSSMAEEEESTTLSSSSVASEEEEENIATSSSRFNSIEEEQAQSNAAANQMALQYLIFLSTTNNSNAANASDFDQKLTAALNGLVANPDARNVQRALDAGFQKELVPYIGEARADLHLSAGLTEDQVTEAQRRDFVQGLQGYRLAAAVSAQTPEEAVTLGLRPEIAKYLKEVQGDLGISPGQHLNKGLARAAFEEMKNDHWQRDEKPVVEKVAGIGAVTLLGLGGLVAYSNRRRNSYYY